jgi:hypothetical protein
MVRTQIYLTEHQRDELAAMSKSAGKKQSEFIREAIDRFINQSGSSQRESVLVTQPASGKIVQISLIPSQFAPNGIGTNYDEVDPSGQIEGQPAVERGTGPSCCRVSGYTVNYVVIYCCVVSNRSSSVPRSFRLLDCALKNIYYAESAWPGRVALLNVTIPAGEADYGKKISCCA